MVDMGLLNKKTGSKSGLTYKKIMISWKLKSMFAVTLFCFFIAACSDDKVTGTDEGEVELTTRTVELEAMPFWTDNPSFGPTNEQTNGTA